MTKIDARRATALVATPRPLTRAALALAFAIVCTSASAQGAPPSREAAALQASDVFAGADVKLGEQLIAKHRCSECHARRVGGDGSAIYRPGGRIGTPQALRTMVEYCSTELNLSLFEDEVQAIAAVLQRDHYRFSAR